MSILDDVKGKAQSAMNDDELKEKAQKMAEEHGMSVEAAKEKLMNKKNEE